MKELKEFLKELEKGVVVTDAGSFVTKEFAAKLIAEAYIAGINFEGAQAKKPINNGIQK